MSTILEENVVGVEHTGSIVTFLDKDAGWTSSRGKIQST
jgi:hypothetical protein